MRTPPAPRFGALLKHYRRAAGLTQEALAARAGVSVRGIQNLESGVNQSPRADTLELLAAALGLAAPERAALVAAAGAGRSPRAAVHPPSAAAVAPDALIPLVGRRRELAALADVLAGADARGPTAPLLLLAGEPGIGKTRLLQAVAQQAIAQGWTVLEGGCHRRGGQEPYAPLLDALAQHLHPQMPAPRRRALAGCAWLVRLLPELADLLEPLPAAALPPEQERRLMFAAAARVLSNVAGPAGTLLVLDDLQWAGPDALDLLATILRSSARASRETGASRLCVVGAYRDTEVRPGDPLGLLLADLARAGLARRQALRPLAAEEAAALLDHLLVGLTETERARATAVLERAGGVPLFLVGYAQALRLGMEEAVPWDLAQVVRQRVALLPPAAQELLGVAAIVGRHAPRALLVAATGRPEEEVLAGLEAACRACLLQEEGDEAYAFAHDVIREVVEVDVGAARRAVLHRRVAQALETRPGERPVERLAYHYRYSGEQHRPKAALYLEQAGDKARAQAAHAEAADYYRALVECLEDLGQLLEAAAAREKVGAALASLARYDAALEVYGQAAETYRGVGNLDRLARVSAEMANAYYGKGETEAGIALLQPLLRSLEQQGHVPDLAVVCATLAHLYVNLGRYDEAQTVGARAVALARAVGEGRPEAAALLWSGMALHKMGRVDEALRAVEEVVPLAEAVRDLDLLITALMHLSCQYEDRGELERSTPYGERAFALAECSGDPVLRALMTTRRGMTAFYAGAWDQARACFEAAVALARQAGLPWVSAACLHDLGRLELAEGAWAASGRWLEEGLTIAERTNELFMAQEIQRALAARDLIMGQAERARTRLCGALDQIAPEDWVVPPVLARLAWAQLALDDLSAAEATVARAITRAHALTYRVALTDALRVQAMIFTRQRRWAEAAHSLEGGLTLARRMPYPYAEARLLHVYGALHAQQGEPDAARERWEAALALFRRLGARQDAAQVEQALASLSSCRAAGRPGRERPVSRA